MKVLKVAAIVIGAVALIATGVGAAMGAGMLGGVAAGATTATFLGMSAATFMTIGAIAGVAGGLLSMGVSLLATRPSFGGQGNPLSFQTNPQSGLPYAIGRTRMSGLKTDGKTTSSKTDGTHNLIFLSALLSCTPVQAVTGFTADGIAVTFDGSGAAIGGEAGWMAQKVSLGPMPQTSALSLTLDGRSYPGHSSTTKLSGMTYAEWALKYDPDGNHFSAGLPEPAWIVVGRKCYDPRKDSTYPGGSGAHRAGNEATYEWTRNGPIQALNWAMGHSANGKRVCGIGAPMENIRVADFVEAANIADANAWGCGGVEWTTDSKWDIFKRMLQAGGAVPSMGGAMLGCRVKTPRVSIGTIPQEDFLDGLTYIATKPRRDRFNTVLPRYVSESHDWEVITGSEISVPEWVTADGGKRTKGIDFPLVQAEVGQGYDGNKQAGQLAAYEICDSREASIECTVKPRWIGLRVGDCVTLDKPDDGIVAQKVMITGVTLDPARGVLRLTAETETDSKHAFALGQTTTPPPAPTLNVPAGKPAVPGPAAWAVTAISMADGQPGLRVAGAIDDPIADRVLVQYRRNGLLDWLTAPDIVGSGSRRIDIGPLDGLSGWDVRLAYGAGGQTGNWLEILNTGTGASALRLNPRGSYAAGTAYSPGDVVVWDNGTGNTGASYKRIGTGATTGVAPSDGSKWVLLAIRGQDGLSIAELTIYRRAALAPSTPTGGSYNFGTKVLTPPSGWASTWPSAGNDPVWAASGVTSIVGQTGTAAPTWLGVGQAAANGSTGADGQATNAVFRRSASQPSTPSASAGAPTSWYDSTGAVPAGADPIWVSFGTRPNSAANYTWQTPKRVEGADGADGIPGSVPTLIADNVSGGSMIIAGDTATKAGTSAVDASVYSQESYGSFYLRAVSQGNYFYRIGVHTSVPTVSPIHRFDSQSVAGLDRIIHNGAQVWAGDWGVDAVLEMIGDGKVIRYYIDGALTVTGTTNVAGQWRLAGMASSVGAKLGGLRFSPSGAAGADAVAYVQDATPGAPPNSNQLWIKPSTKQIFRWDGATWVDTHGDLARYNQIVASLFVQDQGVNLAQAQVPGSAFWSTSTSGAQTLTSSSAPSEQLESGILNPSASVSISQYQKYRYDVTYTFTQSDINGTNVFDRNFTPYMAIYYRINSGSWILLVPYFSLVSSTNSAGGTVSSVGGTLDFNTIANGGGIAFPEAADNVQFGYKVKIWKASMNNEIVTVTAHSLKMAAVLWK